MKIKVVYDQYWYDFPVALFKKGRFFKALGLIVWAEVFNTSTHSGLFISIFGLCIYVLTKGD